MPEFRKALTLFRDYHDMIADPVRMSAYETAIAQVVKPGDIVVDLGAGLGILSLLALRAGARRVYAIEHSEALALAQQIAAVNGVSDRIEFIGQNSLKVVLPEPADVLISETLGSFAVDENTLPFTIDARTRLLKPAARMLPERLRLFIAPVHAREHYAGLQAWRQVAGFDFGPALHEALSRMSLVHLDQRRLLAAPQCYADLELATLASPTLTGKHVFQINKPGMIQGVGGWFQAELTAGVVIDTSPGAPATHWQQAFFPFREAISVVKGDYLEFQLDVGPSPHALDNTEITYQYRCTQRGGTPGGERASVPLRR